MHGYDINSNIREDYSVFGASQSDLLSENEKRLCDKAGITMASSEVLVYSGMTVSNSTITSAIRSQSTKRDNSCVMIDGGECAWGLIQKVFSFKSDDSPSYYCLVTLLPLASEQVCKDTLTNARLEDHLVVCDPPW